MVATLGIIIFFCHCPHNKHCRYCDLGVISSYCKECNFLMPDHYQESHSSLVYNPEFRLLWEHDSHEYNASVISLWICTVTIIYTYLPISTPYHTLHCFFMIIVLSAIMFILLIIAIVIITVLPLI